MIVSRDPRIDLLRTVGVVVLVLAHVGPPAAVFQLRNFDVPLMVLLAGASYGLSSAATQPYGRYLRRRVKHLLGPVWGFLTCYFMLAWAIELPIPNLDGDRILKSYLLVSGIGYVWIFRVFLLLTLLAPALAWFNHWLRNTDLLVTVAGLLLLQEALLWWADPRQPLLLVVGYVLPYASCWLLGLRLPALSGQWIWGILLVSGAGCLALAVLHEWQPTQLHKYPPDTYYLSYALAVSLLGWLAAPVLWRQIGNKGQKLIGFVSGHSLWVYLWQIPLVPLTASWGWGLRWPAVLAGSVVLAWAQVTAGQAIARQRVPEYPGRPVGTL